MIKLEPDSSAMHMQAIMKMILTRPIDTFRSQLSCTCLKNVTALIVSPLVKFPCRENSNSFRYMIVLIV